MITPSEFRRNIYNLLDKVIETGVPLEIKRKGKVEKLIIEDKPNKLEKLKKHPNVVNGDVDDLININWLENWKSHI
jgi:hypothetical protein